MGEREASRPGDHGAAQRCGSRTAHGIGHLSHHRDEPRADTGTTAGVTTLYRTTSTGTGLRFSDPSATLPSRMRSRPVTPRAPTTRRCALDSLTTPSSDVNGSPAAILICVFQPLSRNVIAADSRRARVSAIL